MTTHSHDDLEELVARCRKGDSEAWHRLIARFERLVFSVPKRHGLNADDSADVFQTTFHALLRNIDRIDSVHGLPRWLALTASRESQRLRRVSSRYASSDDTGLNLEELLASEDKAAEQEAVEMEASQAVRDGVARLPAKCRQILTLLYLDHELPYVEVARQMGMPIGSIGPTRARCLERLRQDLLTTGFF